jgi:hypothetical protein
LKKQYATGTNVLFGLITNWNKPDCSNKQVSW